MKLLLPFALAIMAGCAFETTPSTEVEAPPSAIESAPPFECKKADDCAIPAPGTCSTVRCEKHACVYVRIKCVP